MGNYVSNHIFIDGPIDYVLYLYEKYEDKELKFNPRRVISSEEWTKIIELFKKRGKDEWDASFYWSAFWFNIDTDEIKRKELKSCDDLPWYISFESKWMCPTHLIKELIRQNPSLRFEIDWYSDYWSKWKIIWENWKSFIFDIRDNPKFG